MPTTGMIFAEEGFAHDTGEGHPECPGRLRAIRDAFASAEFSLPSMAPRRATYADLLRVHSEEHVAAIEMTCVTNTGYPDPDTVMMEGSWEAALLSAGSAIAASEAVLDGKFTNVFSVCRPPGHHAERDFAMGFCLFNNVAIAAKWLRQVRDVGRVAIVDWDVHHGNGTQHTFYNDPTVYYVSLHESPLYPGTGKPGERGEADTNLNVVFPAGAPAEDWLRAIENCVLPELEAFSPDFLLISAGFDAFRGDPLAHQNLEPQHYTEMTNRLKGLAGGRVVSLLEGGYNLAGLGQCALAHARALQAG